MATESTKRALVTGANGFVASHVVKQLLNRGYIVRGTVRDPTNPTKVGHLERLPHSDRLSLVAADLLVPDSFDEAVKDCDYVFHTASPFFFSGVTDPEAQLLRPAEEGTLSLLNSVAKAGHKPKVVITSSIAAIYVKNAEPDHAFTEADWSDEEFMRSREIWYPLSKTIAERAGKELVEALGASSTFPVAWVNPVLVTGQMLQKTLNTSSEMILKYLDGSKTEINIGSFNFVDVEDVATAHIEAAERSTTGQRFLLNGGSVPHSAVAESLLRQFPEYADKIPTKVKEGKPKPLNTLVTDKAEKELGLGWTSLDETLHKTVTSLKLHGFLDAAEK